MPQFRTLIIAAQDAPFAREITERIDPLNYSFMFLAGLSPTGEEPPTHFVSTGYISDNVALMVPLATFEFTDGTWTQTDYYPGRPDIAAERAAEVGMTVTPEQIADIFSRADSTAQEPFTAFARLGLQLVREESPI